MKQVTDYYFDLQNITDTDDCSDNCNDNVILLFKQIIKSILKDHTEYDITVLDNDTELFKMTGGDGVTSFPYKHIEEIMDIFIQKNKFIEEKKDDLYNSLYNLEKKSESVSVGIPSVIEPPIVEPDIALSSDREISNIENNANQINGYKNKQSNLFDRINNIITVKISIYKNNIIENSFLKKLKIENSFLK